MIFSKECGGHHNPKRNRNPNPNFEFWTPKEAKSRFLARFYELKSKIENK